MIKQIQLFLSTKDEAALSDSIRAVRPSVVFIDDSRWDTATPPVKPSIAACSSAFAFLWDKGIVGTLPSRIRIDGKFDGPQSGPVIAIWRSSQQDNLLLSGRLAASTDVADKSVTTVLDAFVADVWKVMKELTEPVVVVDRATGMVVRDKVTEYRAGTNAAAWAKLVPEHYFRDRSAQVFFKPKSCG